ncbi:Thiosulfate sulfurtransferase, rhodanese [Planococcus halocryophilus Or1]|uniref:Sulfurtransferase n=1 Tax=Planococcus halocryophilus TaxID=1215089 RepID=A0A1C7DVD1_9BACL|nr:sulfurtransferase [Planococcus halocryophilus]ANU15364.1 sulfurtransferase [Planococcus halocryophilus]EMF47730.1 Thiosulfate sulfurtransferase, rhodanese [Planococcus halocryophilus Or1]
MEQIPLIVTTEWLEKRLDDPDLCIIDATIFMELPEKGGPPTIWSGKTSYGEGHIPGAVHMDILKDLSDPQSAQPFTVPPRDYFIRKMTELGIGDDMYTVIYDQGALVGNPIVAAYWASRLAWQMQYEGFENIAILEGGLPKWKKENRPLTAVPGNYSQTNFTGERRTEMLATKEEVKRAMEDDNTILINSLSPEDFRGESDAYARKGHIPSSKNVFFGIHANQQTREIHDEAMLRKQFEKIDALNPNKKVITYCGGGLAATWTALMLNKLGQKNVAVYDGSLNEWVNDPTCPLVTES